MTSTEHPPASDPQDHPAGRVEGISTKTLELPKPVEHGATGQVVLNDHVRKSRDIDWDPGEYATLPDGSLYQTARAAWMDLDPDGQTAVLTRDYSPDWFGEADPDSVAVTLTSSRWKAGTGEGDDYSPFFSYDLTIRPTDEDREIQHHRTPIRSLSLKIMPQYEEMVYPDGNGLNPPFGEGTLLHITSTYVDSHDVLEERAAEIVEDCLGYQFAPLDVAQGSRRDWKAEVYHRIRVERLDDLVATIRQSQELIPHHEGDVSTSGKANGGDWTEIRIDTSDWHQLGFERLEANCYLKVYHMDNVENLDFPLDQPKVEAGILGSNDTKFHADKFDKILEHLREIVLSHIHWAGLQETDLVHDEISLGPDAVNYEWQHPEGRRTWLRSHYESFVPDLYREANRERTLLTYDILEVMRRRKSATYEELQEQTGAAYRTVREHVRRLAAIGPKDEPGILHRKRGAVTLVTWAPEMRELAGDVIDETNPGDSPRDMARRRELRKKRRQQRQESENQDTGDDDGEEGSTNRTWKRADRLDRDRKELARAIQGDLLELEDIRININPYHWIDDPDTG